MPASVFRLEPLDGFLRHTTELNRLYAPDDPAHDVTLGRDTQDGEVLKRAAWRRHLLAAIHHGFPRHVAPHEAAAYLVRAFAGLRPFDEGNHRTGWDYTAEVLQHAGHELVATEEEGRALGNSLWDDLEGFTEAQLADRGPGFDGLVDWFKDRIASS